MSQADIATIIAHERGYRVLRDGTLVSPKGVSLKTKKIEEDIMSIAYILMAKGLYLGFTDFVHTKNLEVPCFLRNALDISTATEQITHGII